MVDVGDYPVTVKWDWYAKCWVAKAVDFPRCIGDGLSEVKAIADVRFRLKAHISDIQEAGGKIPSPSVLR